MASIENISIHVASPDDLLSGQAEAVLSEVAEMLGHLLEEGGEDSIDLRGLPLTQADRDWLDEQLGRGEVTIELQAGGASVLYETAYPGVWKVVHRDLQDRVLVELIEVAWVPAIIRANPEEVRSGYEELRQLLKSRI